MAVGAGLIAPRPEETVVEDVAKESSAEDCVGRWLSGSVKVLGIWSGLILPSKSRSNTLTNTIVMAKRTARRRSSDRIRSLPSIAFPFCFTPIIRHYLYLSTLPVGRVEFSLGARSLS